MNFFCWKILNSFNFLKLIKICKKTSNFLLLILLLFFMIWMTLNIFSIFILFHHLFDSIFSRLLSVRNWLKCINWTCWISFLWSVIIFHRYCTKLRLLLLPNVRDTFLLNFFITLRILSNNINWLVTSNWTFLAYCTINSLFLYRNKFHILLALKWLPIWPFSVIDWNLLSLNIIWDFPHNSINSLLNRPSFYNNLPTIILTRMLRVLLWRYISISLRLLMKSIVLANNILLLWELLSILSLNNQTIFISNVSIFVAFSSVTLTSAIIFSQLS